MRIIEIIESLLTNETCSGSIATVVNPSVKKKKSTKGKLPKNALDGDSLMAGSVIKRV